MSLPAHVAPPDRSRHKEHPWLDRLDDYVRHHGDGAVLCLGVSKSRGTVRLEIWAHATDLTHPDGRPAVTTTGHDLSKLNSLSRAMLGYIQRQEEQGG